MKSLFPVRCALLMLAVAGCGRSKEAEKPKPEATAVKEAPVQEAPKAQPSAGGPLRIAYSDWPGWVAWDIGIQKGWFAEEGVAVDFKWFEYVPSMEAFSAGKVDAVTMTNG